jgi:hypothetical protein
MPHIGILSSIKFKGTDLEKAFDKGIGNSDPDRNNRNYQDNLGRDPTRVAQAVQALNADAQLLLVVVAGGIYIETMAAGLHKKYVSIVGGLINSSLTPGTTVDFRDRVNLESFTTNQARLNHLSTRFNIGPSEVCLLRNLPTKAPETGAGSPAWLHVEPTDFVGSESSATASDKFKTAFTHISQMRNAADPREVRAVIVSADPFYYQFSAELVGAANSWVSGNTSTGLPRRICYPIYDHNDHRPDPNRTTFFGPHLAKAYRVLGKRAAEVLDSELEQIVDDTPPPPPPVVLWDFLRFWR